MPITFLVAEDNYSQAAMVAKYVETVAEDMGISINDINVIKAFRHKTIVEKIEELKGDPGLIVSFDLQIERGETVRIDDYIAQTFWPNSKTEANQWALNVPMIVFSVAADDLSSKMKNRGNTFIVPKIPRKGTAYDELKSAIKHTLGIVMKRLA